MIIGTASFLTEYKLTKLERRVPAEQNALPQDFVRAVFGKVQTFWVLRELPETQPDRTKAGKMDFFLTDVSQYD